VQEKYITESQITPLRKFFLNSQNFYFKNLHYFNAF
jgi:hypothetical protein